MYSKSISLLLIFGFCLQSLYAQVCADPLNIIYGLQQNGSVVPINVNTQIVDSTLTGTGSAGYPGSTNDANAIGLDIQTETFYYFQQNADNSQQFVSFNSATNQYTALAVSPIRGGVVKGCVTADGTGYYCIDGDGDVCYYNIAGNSWTVISSNLKDQFNNNLGGTFSSLGSGDIAIDGLGNLWIVVSNPTQWGLYELKAPLPVNPVATLQLTEMIAPTQTTPAGTQFAGIAYNATGQIYLSTGNDLYLLQNDLSITHIGTFSVAGSGADLTSCNYPIDILSLCWTNFTASLLHNNSVLLTWSVNQQTNNNGYNIEHSKDGKSWDVVGYQLNNQNKGTTNYIFTHTSPVIGVNYYRIKRSGIDGKLSYSEVRKVNITGNNVVSIWPVPADNIINIQARSNAIKISGKVIIFNSLGKMVATCLLHGGVNTIDISSLVGGNYIVHAIFSNGEIIKEKLLKL
jgi:hypothetical protein